MHSLPPNAGTAFVDILVVPYVEMLISVSVNDKGQPVKIALLNYL